MSFSHVLNILTSHSLSSTTLLQVATKLGYEAKSLAIDSFSYKQAGRIALEL